LIKNLESPVNENSMDEEEQLSNMYHLKLVLQNRTPAKATVAEPELAPHAYSP
jgi:hypothetical protein